MCMVSRHGYRGLVHAPILLFFQFVFGLAAPLAAQEAATQAPPAKVHQLIELLDDPDVRRWLAAKQTTATAAVLPPAGDASRLVAGIRRHLSGMRQAIPRVFPEWIAARERIAHELKNGVTRPIVWGLSLVLIVGYAAEFLTRYALRRSACQKAAEPGPGLATFIRIAPLVAELGPLIIETVKMKGVEQFGEYGITLGFAMTTKPGHQTQVRRRAQALIKDAFKTHGIHFASPTVQVAGDEAQSSMAAAAMTRDTIAKKNAALAAQQEGEAAAE
ncbi:mechanosensitive ion channel family protein (plasmid) [Sinorhizobium meliloti WSM1022]|nr:mechanosensitive ion channel family protein [Sinorhizobium meliloti]MDE3831373.1 mechanosensitive ion channel family protein [Sinorhizobium meliloti]MDE4579056.1 mechanosensitive ion channel family protein [Sinorhizobium meliloti]MDW9627756.1 hypothetical protein [Sinorhizobium meliloti]MDW9714074.1 hypothetical protein [Sinorhizobium meliloti]MDW9751173.1 hypothetical protein [Sinorhizobium meliloti]